LLATPLHRYMYSPVANEERMRFGHWFDSVHCDPFSDLTLLAG